MRRAVAVVLLSSALACGGRIQGAPDGSGDAGEASADVAQSDGGSSLCESASGVGICGGPNQCGAQCSYCWPPYPTEDAGELRVCQSSAYNVDGGADSDKCPDGTIDACREARNAPFCMDMCAQEALGQLYALNGRPDLARYADRSTYTGASLPPPPTTCPAVTAPLTLCGGACGQCTGQEVCMGRSPMHPISMCIDNTSNVFGCVRGDPGTCNGLYPSMQCMTFVVDSAGQTWADQDSLCVPSTLCQAAAQSYPGGVVCTP